MNILINIDGCLWLRRSGTLKEQLCPYRSGGPIVGYCGDWCALFREPLINGPQVVVRICKAKYYTDKEHFRDLRG